MKKGFYFSIDAFLASILIVGGIMLLSQTIVEEEATETMDFVSKDLLAALTELQVKEMKHQTIVQMVGNGDIENTNNSLLEQLGEFWSQNQTVLAQNFTQAIVQEILPKRFGLLLEIGGDSIHYENNSVSQNNIVTSRRMVTGVKKGAALTGSTASAYLKRIKQKTTSSFLYFGGFVGQGNITAYIRDLPTDLTNQSIQEMIIEGDLEENFQLYINNDYCGNFTPSGANMSADRWDVTSCNSSITTGDNEFRLVFSGGLNKAYVGGGFVKITYLTQEQRSGILSGNMKYWFPGIKGLINLYDGFYVPGTIESMEIYLHYLANHSIANNTLYLTIGNKTVFVDHDSVTEQFVFLSDDNVSAQLSYSPLGLTTIPLRIGFENLSFLTEFVGNARVMLVTDVSGSMEWEFDSSSAGTRRNCEDPLLNDSSTTRLSVAKCMDKQFAKDIVDIDGNLAGLASYEETLHAFETLNPTTNLTLVNQTVGIATPESGYTASGATCICCGINGAYDVLAAGVTSTTFIENSTSWLYTTNGFAGAPSPDGEGDKWYELDYNDSSWNSGNAVLGSNENNVGPLIVTDMGNTLANDSRYPELWELAADAGMPVDFTSGLNQTGNTFGESNGVNNDGWDSSFGYFGTAGTDVDMNTDPNEDGNQSDNTVNTDDELRIYIGNSWDDDAPSSDEIPDSGAFGIEFYISPEMFAVLNSTSGSAQANFDWRIDPTYLDNGEEGWIKAQFGTNGSMNYLGTNMDENGSISDATLEVFWCEDTGSSAPDPLHECPNPGGDTFSEDVKQYINQSGWYYLVIGAIATEQTGDTTWDEDWRFYFDNIYLEIVNNTDKYYLRKHFNITNLDLAKKGLVHLLSDDTAKVYVNGNLVYEDTSTNKPSYWNKRGIRVDQNYLKVGDNVVATELSNSNAAAKFDLKLLGLNTSQDFAMMVMTDGQANRQCARQGTGNSDSDAIQAACDAKEDFGITVYAVGFSDSADLSTLQGISACGEGLYRKSNNVAELEEFYKDVAQSIISASKQSQTVVVSEGFAESELFSDSYVEINYTPGIAQAGPNEISTVVQTQQFDTCNPAINIFQGLRVLEAIVTSYSGEHWTDLLTVNGNVSYNLSTYSSNYSAMGDPYVIYVPPQYLTNGNNNLQLKTGDSPTNNTGCSANNSMIYTAAVNLSTSRTEVLELAVGCNWEVEFENGDTINFQIPTTYAGAKTCSYNSSQISYDVNDAYDFATYQIFTQLDFDDDGRIFVDFYAEDLEILVTLISEVPYLWGPAIAEVQVWS